MQGDILHLTGISMLAGSAVVPLSSFGGEGQGKEAVVCMQRAR
jgi:hypothetical protein